MQSDSCVTVISIARAMSSADKHHALAPRAHPRSRAARASSHARPGHWVNRHQLSDTLCGND